MAELEKGRLEEAGDARQLRAPWLRQDPAPSGRRW